MRIVRKVVLAAGLALLGCSDDQSGILAGVDGGASLTDGFNSGGSFIGTDPTPPTINLEAPAAPAGEGTTLTVTVRLSNSFNQDITIPFTVTTEDIGVTAAVTPETAGAGDIVQLIASPMTIPAGQTTGLITFTVVDDPFQEVPAVETFTVTLGSPSAGTIGTGSASVSIIDVDDDGLGSSISGRVTNAATGTGVDAALALLLPASGGSFTDTADALGFYRFDTPTPDPYHIAIYAKTGHVVQVRAIEALTTAQSAVVVNVPMLPVAVEESFDPTAPHVTTVPGSLAQASFPADAFETQAGAAPTGNVVFQLTPIAPSTDVNLLPGDYLSNPRIPVESFGAVAMQAGDSAAPANVLRLAPGKSMTLRIPASTRGTPLPATAAMYFFSTSSALWVQESTGTLQGAAPNQYYEMTTTVTSNFWSAMAAFPTTDVTGCVVDPTGSRVAGAVVVAEGTNYAAALNAVTDSEGNFSVPVRSGSGAFVQANFRTGLSSARTTTGGTLSPCLLVIAGAASIRLTWGEQPSDLDSHTLGPNQEDHVYWISKGSLVSHPFIGLDVDDVDGFGPEVTTIVKAARNRTYRFIVQNFVETFPPGITDSPAKVELFVKGKQYVFTPPPGELGTDPVSDTPTWHVFDFTTDAACEITTITPSTNPWLNSDDAGIDQPSMNPNTDNAATFCN